MLDVGILGCWEQRARGWMVSMADLAETEDGGSEVGKMEEKR